MPEAVNCGVRLRWEESGAGEPILLIHGFGYTMGMWQRTVGALEGRRRVIRFDNRGAGGSDCPDGYSIAGMADDAVAVLDAAGVERADIAGASLGGAVAQEVALRHAERVRGLILVCTMSGGAPGLPPVPPAAEEPEPVRAIRRWSSHDRLPSIATPALVIHGATDRLVPPECGRVIAERIPGARLVLIPDAGHILFADAPDAVHAAMVEFLDQLSSGSSR